MRRTTERAPRAAIAAPALIGLMALAWMTGCENSDPVAPEDSTITVSANPQTVVVPAGTNGAAEITAVLRSKNGTRLPDQEVTFSSSAGSLDPPAETAILTDDDGVAECTLITNNNTTITARSGSVSATTQVQTTSADLSPFLLDISPTDTLDTCSDPPLTLTATVTDVNGQPVSGVLVIFNEVSPSNHEGQFTPTSGQTTSNSMGLATVTWRPGPTCSDDCSTTGGGIGDCIIFITARDVTGDFESIEVEIIDNIP